MVLVEGIVTYTINIPIAKLIIKTGTLINLKILKRKKSFDNI